MYHRPPTNTAAARQAPLSMWPCAPCVPPQRRDHDQDSQYAPKVAPYHAQFPPGATFATRRSGVRVPLAPLPSFLP
jgi:hypothetical protein